MDITHIFNQLRSVIIEKQSILNQYLKTKQKNQQHVSTNIQSHLKGCPKCHQQQNKVSNPKEGNESYQILQSALQTLRKEERIMRQKKYTLLDQRMNLKVQNKNLQNQAMEIDESNSYLLQKINLKPPKKIEYSIHVNDDQDPNTKKLDQVQKENILKNKQLLEFQAQIQDQKSQLKDTYQKYQCLMLLIDDQKKTTERLKKQNDTVEFKIGNEIVERNNLKKRQRSILEKREEIKCWQEKVKKMEQVRHMLIQSMERCIQCDENYLQEYLEASNLINQ